MSLTIGTRIGSFEVLGSLGAGGMGEVYRARDTKLDREVAIKVLPEAFAQDHERVARFAREAKMLASLNHPNIGGIHGLEETGGITALVLELVEGPTLAERIARGAIPLDEALAIAKQIAEALEAAHEQGVIHRDLKPANIKVRDDGTVKVLDFGLAKLVNAGGETGPASAAMPLSQSPTMMSMGATQAGMLLGTAAYMSPEQAKGRDADKRSDIWAFGAVLYEMLTGRSAFGGEDVADTLAFVLSREPDWTRLPAHVPQALRTLIARCLTKDRRQRVSEIATAKFLLVEVGNLSTTPAQTASHVTAAARSRWRRALPLGAASAVGGLLVGAAAWLWTPARPSPVVAQFSFNLPEGQAFTGTARQLLAISADGTRLAYVADRRIYLRSVGELEPHAIAGTQGSPTIPMFAPDGESIAYLQLDSPGAILRRIPISGGTATTMATLQGTPNDATWGPAGILIAVNDVGIFRVPSNGGMPERIIEYGRDERAAAPQWLPGEHTVLFSLLNRERESDVVVQSPTGGRRVLIEDAWAVRYLPTGHLLYAIAGTVFARPFDAASLAFTGPGTPVIGGVRRNRSDREVPLVPLAVVSESGTLVYIPGPAESTTRTLNLVIGDGSNTPEALNVETAAWEHPRVSPDGRTLAVGRAEAGGFDLWIYDLPGKTRIRKLTQGGRSRFPVWSHDGRRITFQSEREGHRGIFWQRADGSGIAEPLTRAADGEEHRPEAWSGDGRRLLFSVTKEARNYLWVLTLEGKKTEPVGAIESAEPFSASFSRDGQWIAYAFSDMRGGSGYDAPSRGVYVAPFPPTAEKHQVPRAEFAEIHPLWSPNGEQLFFSAGSSTPMAIPIRTNPSVAFGTPVELPRGPRTDIRSSDVRGRGYDVLPDGRFVSVSPVFGEGAASGEIRVVLNWFTELQQRVPVK